MPIFVIILKMQYYWIMNISNTDYETALNDFDIKNFSYIKYGTFLWMFTKNVFQNKGNLDSFIKIKTSILAP